MKRSIILFLIVFIGGSCSNLTKVLKNPDIDEKYKAAVNFYDNEDYYRAGLVFEDLLPNMIGKKEAEFVQFYYAYCHYNQKQYDLSAYYFKQFYDTYRRSEFAEEALYMFAYSNYKSTPDFNLDQSNTNAAIEAMQDFLNIFPKSSYTEKGTEVIDELREKLEMKAYTVAKQYHRLRRYKAAVIAYENFQRDFPDSDLKEEISYRKIEAEYELSKMSIQAMKQERYQKTIEYYYYLLDRFPESDYIKEAESIFQETQKELEDLGIN
ncbi:MAG: outer membrane protein assembly factor BamD [Bacteroidota bacterium]